MPRYFALPNTVYIPIWNSAGTDTVAGITTASMSATVYRDDGAGAPASAAPFSAGGGWYGVRLDDAENSADYVRVFLRVSASGAMGLVEYQNSHDIVEYGTAQNASSLGLTFRNNFRGSGTSSLYVGAILEILEGPGAGQNRVIAVMTSGGGIVVSSAFATIPTSAVYQVRRGDQDVVDIAAIVSGALSSYGVLTSGQMSTLFAAAMANYDIATSADVSAIVNVAAWTGSMTEPGSAPEWTSVNRGQALAWLTMRVTNKHEQGSTRQVVYSSSGVEIASASVGDNLTSAVRDQFLG